MGVPYADVTAAPAQAASSGKWYDEAYFAKPAPITDISETVEADVVVVGAGNGGCVAAVSAAELARIGIPARKIPRILGELTALLQADPGLADRPTALRLARALDALLP